MASFILYGQISVLFILRHYLLNLDQREEGGGLVSTVFVVQFLVFF